MTDNLTLNMDAYLPQRDVVNNTLREAMLKRELKPGSNQNACAGGACSHNAEKGRRGCQDDSQGYGGCA